MNKNTTDQVNASGVTPSQMLDGFILATSELSETLGAAFDLVAETPEDKEVKQGIMAFVDDIFEALFPLAADHARRIRSGEELSVDDFHAEVEIEALEGTNNVGA